jgi:PadR family transcriptional regulator, regulatory protein PadR
MLVPDRKDIPQGTLDLLILRILSREPMHGWGIMQRLRDVTDDVFQVTPGSLFPALQRIEESGWASGKWDISENNRKAKYYAISKAGKRQLAAEAKNWERVAGVIDRVLTLSPRRS